ncbi:MAG: HAD-IB family phosphatase, partial [Actinomycetota bacterium]
AILCDFDGTIVEQDVSEELLASHGDPGWRAIDDAFVRGEIGSRECATRQVAMLGGTRDELVASALARYHVDPTFAPFVTWCGDAGIEISVVSDGFGFYIEAMLEAAGVDGVPVLTNRTVFDGGTPRLEFPFAHPECVGCGTCKRNAVLDARDRLGGPVAFVGEGHTDRYGALYADLVFAKKYLPELCDEMGISYVTWETFDDIRMALDVGMDAKERSAPERCPGWATREGQPW